MKSNFEIKVSIILLVLLLELIKTWNLLILFFQNWIRYQIYRTYSKSFLLTTKFNKEITKTITNFLKHFLY